MKANVSFNGIDLSTVVTAVTFDPKWSDAMMGKIAGLSDISFTVRGYWAGPGPIQQYIAARRARISRMHAMYRQRRRGRW